MLRLMFTDNAIHSTGALEMLGGGKKHTCFAQVSLGIDTRNFPVWHGLHNSHAPLLNPLPDPTTAAISANQGAFDNALYVALQAHDAEVVAATAVRGISEGGLADLANAPSPPLLPRRVACDVVAAAGHHVMIVRRQTTRRILNYAALVNHIVERARAADPRFGGRNLRLSEVAFERVPFHQQLRRLSDTTVLVAAHGQGASNAVFMPRGAALVLLMPEGWVGWKWLYGNIAVASGMSVFVHRIGVEAAATNDLTSGWTPGALNVDLRSAVRDADLTVDPVKMMVSLGGAFEAAARCGTVPEMHVV